MDNAVVMLTSRAELKKIWLEPAGLGSKSYTYEPSQP